MVDIDKTRKSKVLTLVDVYDIAADIGKEFESLISDEGTEKVTQLMQKVIAALEHLEVLVHNNDNEQTYLEDLRRTIEHLELEDTLAKFFNVNESIMYSDSESTVASVVPAFAKRGDVVIVDIKGFAANEDGTKGEPPGRYPRRPGSNRAHAGFRAVMR